MTRLDVAEPEPRDAGPRLAERDVHSRRRRLIEPQVVQRGGVERGGTAHPRCDREQAEHRLYQLKGSELGRVLDGSGWKPPAIFPCLPTGTTATGVRCAR